MSVATDILSADGHRITDVCTTDLGDELVLTRSPATPAGAPGTTTAGKVPHGAVANVLVGHLERPLVEAGGCTSFAFTPGVDSGR